VKSLEFDPAGFEDLAWWVETDRKKALRVIKLIKEVQRDPFYEVLVKSHQKNFETLSA
jgi:toxin YoeB